MPDVTIVAALVSAVAAFVVGAAYYAALGDQLARVSDAATSRANSVSETSVLRPGTRLTWVALTNHSSATRCSSP